jgi:streptomycin 6-kinase
MGVPGSLSIPKNFEERVISTFGSEGGKWLEDLPDQINKYLHLWDLKIAGHFDELSFNFVIPVERKSGVLAVLKLGLHSQGRLREVAALNHFSGNGAISVLECDQKTGASLLERAMPGRPLKTLYLNHEEEKVNQVATSIILQLQSAPSPKDLSAFKDVAEWGKGFLKFLQNQTDLSEELTAKIMEAHNSFQELIRTTSKKIVLHADLHHSNILSSERNSYIAIDPKGMYGDPVYELGAWIRNPMPEILKASDLESIFVGRICMMSDALRFDRKRAWRWAYSQAWLAAVWALEDKSSDSGSWLQIARAIENVKDKI